MKRDICLISYPPDSGLYPSGALEWPKFYYRISRGNQVNPRNRYSRVYADWTTIKTRFIKRENKERCVIERSANGREWASFDLSHPKVPSNWYYDSENQQVEVFGSEPLESEIILPGDVVVPLKEPKKEAKIETKEKTPKPIIERIDLPTRICQLLEEKESGMTRVSIREELKCKTQTLIETLETLVEQGMIEKTPKPGRGGGFLYSTPTPSPSHSTPSPSLRDRTLVFLDAASL